MKFSHPAIVFFLIIGLAGMGCKAKLPVTANAEREKAQNTFGTVPEARRVEFNEYFFNANKEKILGNYVLAIELLNRCSSIDPANDAVAFMYAEIYYLNQKAKEAESWIEKAIFLNESNTWYYQLAGDIYQTNRDFTKAAKAYRKLIELEPTPDNYMNLANALIYNREIDEAIKVYDEMESKFGVAEEITEQKEQLYILTGRIEKAIEEVEKLAKAHPGNQRYKGMLAELYLRKGDLKSAQKIYEEALLENTNDGRAHFGLAEIYRQQERSEKMFFHLDAAFDDASIDVAEKTNVLISILPLVNRDTTLLSAVLLLGKKLVSVHPHEAATHAIYGDILFGNDDFTTALIEYRKSRELKRDNFSVYQQIVLCYEGLKRYDSMAIEAELAIEYFPNQTLLYYLLSSARMQLKDYPKAVAAAESALSLGVTNTELEVILYAMIGDAQHFMNNYKESNEAYGKGLEIDPENTYILNNYAYFLSVRKENLDYALSMSKKTVDAEPDNATYLDTYGWIFFQKGDYDNAIIHLQKAAELKPNDADVLEHYGDALFKLGRTEEAFINWNKARENGGESEALSKKVKERKWVE